MQLSECAQGDVVQNVGNHSFYRYERPEGDRSRIRPLELFPNGLLIAKPTDTIVESDLLVRHVGPWTDSMFVQLQPGDVRQRKTYEREQERKMDMLQKLQAEALVIDPKQRGSHANKIKAVVVRLEALNRGLSDTPHGTALQPVDSPDQPRFMIRDVVQLPSGQPARFLGNVNTTLGSLAAVATSHSAYYVDPGVLRPISERWVSTVG